MQCVLRHIFQIYSFICFLKYLIVKEKRKQNKNLNKKNPAELKKKRSVDSDNKRFESESKCCYPEAIILHENNKDFMLGFHAISKSFAVSFASSIKWKLKDKIFTLHLFFLAILRSLAVIRGCSMKWKLKRKMFYSLSNAFLSIRGQLNGFFFSLRISGILILFGYYLWQFFKNKKIKMLFAILITKFQKKSNKKKKCPQPSACDPSQCLRQILLDMDIKMRSNQGRKLLF